MSLSNQPSNAEPSMDEILSSIRRILKDDEPMTVAAESNDPTSQPDQAPDPVMVLDSSMMVPDPAPSGRQNQAEPPRSEPIGVQPSLSTETPPGTATEQAFEPHLDAPTPILGARAAEAASSHIGALVRTISADRNLTVSRGGISIEEIVREEIRPMLKAWLDAHLPGLVERVVRVEIERLVGRDGY